MKRYLMTTTLFVALVTGAMSGAQAQNGPNPPRIKIKAELPLQLPPDVHFGEVAGISTNSKGHVFTFSRANVQGDALTGIAAQLLEFDANGKFVREIGRGLYGFAFAHSVRIDKEDNIWVVDNGSNMVIKLSPEGRVLQTQGRKDEVQSFRPPPWANGRGNDERAAVHRGGAFNLPTDVAFDSAGNVYVSDGYRNARVVKINKDGDWVTSWGERGTGPSQFLTVHGVAVDNKDNVYVADRGNARIQVFDANGKFLRQFSITGQVSAYDLKPGMPNPNPAYVGGPIPRRTDDDPNVPKAYPDKPPVNLTSVPGAPLSICINPGERQFLYIGDANPSRIYKVTLEGKVVGMIGDPGTQPGEFRSAHGLACPDEKTLWVGDSRNWRAQKLTLLE